MNKAQMTRSMYHKIMTRVNELSIDQKNDLINEIISELVNERHSDNNQRIVGIYEAMELVLNMDIIN
jgi:uncharacterized protein YozE (UPF0346 family)